MNINKHWTRWIHVSIHKHFSDAIIAAGIPFFIEAQHRETRDDKTLVECRIGGPDFDEVSQNYFNVDLSLQLLLQFAMNDTNYHTMLKIQGEVLSKMEGITVYRYGDPAEDPLNDDSLLGCLAIEGPVGTRQLGKIKKDVKLQQAYVIADYTMCLQN